MELGLSGRRALVLGASQGLGLAIAAGLAAEGVGVTLAARDAGRLAEAARTVGSAGTLVLDLAQPAAVEAALPRLADAGIDILILNGGGPPAGLASAVDAATLAAQAQAMVAAPIAIANAVLPGMRARGWGRILCVLSSGVVAPIPNLGLSNSLRSALLGWAKTLAEEVAADGVTVNGLVPGRIHTARVDQLDEAAAKRQGRTVAEVATASRATIPMGRYGQPEEFADAACFLVSDRAGYITGTTLRVDGGLIRSK